MAAVIFEELYGKNIIQLGVLMREGNTVGLATDTLEHTEGSNLTGWKLTILKFEVFRGEFDEVSNSELF